MAKSEHQGLQIALIVFAMLTVVLAITTFVYYGESEKSASLAEGEKEKAAAATKRADDFQGKFDYVRHILGVKTLSEAEVETLVAGFASDEEMKGVVKSYSDFVDTFGAGMPKERLNFIHVAPEVLTSVRDRSNSLLQQTAEAAKLATELAATRSKEAERTEVALKAQQDADRKLEEERAKYEEDRKSLEGRQATQLARFDAEINKKKLEVDKAKEAEEKLQQEKAKQVVVIRDQAKTIETLRDEPFEVADGQVTWVNQSAKTVWINLGLADGLRRQTLFSVYDQADNGVTRTARKASIEVTRVLDQHLAEGRIIFDVPANPILRGDQIFSPAWRPGTRVRFALVGLIDIDGDQRSDRNLVRSLLAASGGQIDAEMHDDGQIEGEMTSATRYLVLGERPNERSDPKVLASYSQMSKQAEQLGVELIPVDKLLAWVGYRPEVRSVGLGKNADGAQFKPKPPEGKSPTSTGTVSGKFGGERKPSDKTRPGAKKSAFDK